MRPMSLSALAAMVVLTAAVAAATTTAAPTQAKAQAQAQAACEKVCLEKIADQYRAAYARRDPKLAPIAAHVRFTENNVELRFPKGSWQAITSEVGPALTFSDPVTGNVGITTAILMMDTPGYIAIRLRVENGEITEIEHLLSTKRLVGVAPLQHGDGRPLVHDPQMGTALDPSERVSREEMIRQAAAYWETLGDDKQGVLKNGLKFLDTCQRVENGLPFNKGARCDLGFRNRTYSFNEAVRDRDYPLVDEERGIVFSRAFINHAGNIDTITLADGTVRKVPFREPHSWAVLETFKIVHGAIATIEANFIGAPYGMRSPWNDSDSRRRAQIMSPDEKIAHELARIGTTIAPETLAATEALYRPLHAARADDGITITRDVAYGPDARHRLDLFVPEPRDNGELRPALIFLHGGGFVRGDKSRLGSYLYDNVGRWAARSGAVGISATYRLAPQHPWPAGGEDVAAAVGWVFDNAGRFGIDPRRIFLFGHSAGAVHAATFAGIKPFAEQASRQLAGLVLASGIYDFKTAPRNLVEPAYLGTDAKLYPARSSLAGLASSPLPLLIVAAQHDPEPFLAQASELFAAVVQRGDQQHRPLLMIADGHNHFSEIAQLDAVDTPLGRQILEFMSLSPGIP